MGRLIYKKMDLFDAPEGAVLVHACNGMGVWGSGIAKVFKEQFPNAYPIYRQYCEENGVGTALLIDANSHYIGNLITSNGYGSTLGTKEEILANTTLALDDLCDKLSRLNLDHVYSNKFNSGLFRVPWEETEKILEVFVHRYNLTWVVCEY